MRMRLECSPSPGVACPSADAGKLELFEYVESEGWDNCRSTAAACGGTWHSATAKGGGSYLYP